MRVQNAGKKLRYHVHIALNLIESTWSGVKHDAVGIKAKRRLAGWEVAECSARIHSKFDPIA